MNTASFVSISKVAVLKVRYDTCVKPRSIKSHVYRKARLKSAVAVTYTLRMYFLE